MRSWLLAVFWLAEKEILQNIRNRWIYVIGGLFLFTGLFMVTVGFRVGGTANIWGLDRSSAGFLNILLLALPLVALLLGAPGISAERENGTLDVLLTQPISRCQIIHGKFAGLAFTLALAFFPGLAFTGSILLIKTGVTGLKMYLLLLMIVYMVGLSFLAVSLLLSVFFGSSMQSKGAVLVFWAAMALFYDFLVLGLIVLTNGWLSARLLAVILFLNPIDLGRILILTLWEKGGSTATGAAATFILGPSWRTAAVLMAGIVGWILIPIMGAINIFRKEIIN